MESEKISLETSALAIGMALVINAYPNAEFLLKTLKENSRFEIDESKFGEIHFELIFFYINITDRFAFHYLGDPRRHKFFTLFMEEVCRGSWDGYKAIGGKLQEKEFYLIFNETQKKRQTEYGAYQIEGPKDNLFYEFDRRIVKVLGFDGKDALQMTEIQLILAPVVKKYIEFIKKFLSGISDSDI